MLIDCARLLPTAQDGRLLADADACMLSAAVGKIGKLAILRKFFYFFSCMAVQLPYNHKI